MSHRLWLWPYFFYSSKWNHVNAKHCLTWTKHLHYMQCRLGHHFILIKDSHKKETTVKSSLVLFVIAMVSQQIHCLLTHLLSGQITELFGWLLILMLSRNIKKEKEKTDDFWRWLSIWECVVSCSRQTITKQGSGHRQAELINIKRLAEGHGEHFCSSCSFNMKQVHVRGVVLNVPGWAQLSCKKSLNFTSPLFPEDNHLK